MPSRSHRSRSRSPSRRHKKKHKRSRKSSDGGSPPSSKTTRTVKKDDLSNGKETISETKPLLPSVTLPPSILAQIEPKKEEKVTTPPPAEPSPGEATSTTAPTMKKRKRRWHGDETEKVFLPNMPTTIAAATMTEQQQKIYLRESPKCDDHLCTADEYSLSLFSASTSRRINTSSQGERSGYSSQSTRQVTFISETLNLSSSHHFPSPLSTLRCVRVHIKHKKSTLSFCFFVWCFLLYLVQRFIFAPARSTQQCTRNRVDFLFFEEPLILFVFLVILLRMCDVERQIPIDASDRWDTQDECPTSALRVKSRSNRS